MSYFGKIVATNIEDNYLMIIEINIGISSMCTSGDSNNCRYLSISLGRFIPLLNLT